jgi:hypothetical protein
MAYTGTQIVALTREVMDAVSSSEWSDATLTAWTGMAQWQLWANLLNANRYLNMQQVTVTQDSNGQFDVSSLTTGTGNTTKYFYRILSVAQPAGQTAQVQYFYRQSRYEDFPNPQPNTSLPYVWYRFGSKIQILPVASGQQLTITVNWRPPSIAQLSALADTITFPDGYEPLIAWRAAPLGLLKGGNETQAARDLQAKADVMEHQMLQDLGRESRWPIVAEAFDTAGDWGGGSIG